MGSNRPLIVTSGTGMVRAAPGLPVREDDASIGVDVIPPVASEEAAAAVAARGVNVSVVRLPQVHDTAKQGLITPMIEVYRRNGACAYLRDGLNRWPATHGRDVARLYRLAIERATPGAEYHAVVEEGISLCDIARALGRLDLPVTSIAADGAAAFFGWLGMFAGCDAPASSEHTRKTLGWQPTGPGLIADLEQLQVADG